MVAEWEHPLSHVWLIVALGGTNDSILGLIQRVLGLSWITQFLIPATETPNLRTNSAWNHPINDDAAGCFWLYYQNPHGVPWDEVTLDHDLKALAKVNVSCYCFAETNLDSRWSYIWNAFLHRQQSIWKYANTSFSSIDISSLSDFLTGGTLTSVVGSWSSRVLSKEQDPSGMGWWSSITLVAKQNTKVTIITGYRCTCSNGDASAWTQEKIFMPDHQSKQSPNPRQQFINDLIIYVKAKQCLNNDIILSLDANNIIGEESIGIAKLIRDCRLYDIMDLPDQDPDNQLKDTYGWGRNCRIGYVLAMARLRDCVQWFGALEYNDGIISDHRGLYIDFDPNVLFKGNIANPVSTASQGFTSKNEKRVSAYLDHLEKYWLDHNIELRVHALLEQAPTLSRREVKRCCYEAIDRDVTRGMVSSESKIHKKHFRYEWSVALDQAGYRVCYWGSRYSDITNHSSSPTALARLNQWLHYRNLMMAWHGMEFGSGTSAA